MRRVLLCSLLIMLALAACSDKKSDDKEANSGGQLGLFDWNRDPNTIVVRLDSQPNRESPSYLLNSIPPCTVWGDGHVVWSTTDATGAEEILEARIEDDATLRGFLEDIINRGFYDWEDELIPPSTLDPIIESVTVALYDEVHTVQRFSNWPQNGYAQILDNCRSLSDKPVRVLPTAGWVSAYSVPRDASGPSWLWPPTAPFTLKELAENGESKWLEGSLATEAWLSARETRGSAQVLEQTGEAYLIAIVVPGYSRDSAPAPTGDSASGGS